MKYTCFILFILIGCFVHTSQEVLDQSDLVEIVNNWKTDARIFSVAKKITIFDRLISLVVRVLQPIL